MKNLLLLMLGMLTIQATAQIEISDENAEEKLLVNNDKLIIVDFYATWCGPCKRMDPIIERLAEKYGDRISIYKIDVDENEVDDALSVTSIPTYYFIKNKETLDYMEGAMSEEDFEDLSLNMVVFQVVLQVLVVLKERKVNLVKIVSMRYGMIAML
ncbi:thioredoxin [Nonlabens ulvanivorans]|nr:thioredoxin domain-containing protein [Nonlabens ulvanivorans]GAK94148.1 thioredoxin [Nonlabens ulvanivorans]